MFNGSYRDDGWPLHDDLSRLDPYAIHAERENHGPTNGDLKPVLCEVAVVEPFIRTIEDNDLLSSLIGAEEMESFLDKDLSLQGRRPHPIIPESY
jgi:hypothetical protein